MPTQVLNEGGQIAMRIGFQAPPEVQDFVEDDQSFVCGYFGPFGCAKTSAGVMKSWRYGQAAPGARGAVIRSTWPALRDTTQKTYFEWLPDGVAGEYEVTKKTFWLKTSPGQPPIELLFRAMDDPADIQNVLSLDLAFAHIDEPQGGVGLRRDGTPIVEPGLAFDLFLAILGRLGRQSGYEGQLWMTGNPPPPTHWIPKFFYYDPGKSHRDPPRNPDPERTLYLGTQETNRANLPKGYYERLTRLYGVGTPMARRFVNGEWIAFATEKPFDAEWIRYYGTEAEPQPNFSECLTKIGFDPAISKKDTAARSALVVGSQWQTGRNLNRGRIYIPYVEAGHWSPYEQVDHLLKAFVMHKAKTVLVEDVAYQRSIGDVLDHEARLRGIMVNVELVPPDADKLRRANAWSALVEDGTVLFGPTTAELVQCMMDIPDDATKWDLVDAAGMLIRSFPRMQGESEKIPGQQAVVKTIAQSYATKPRDDAPRRRGIPPGLIPNQPNEWKKRAIGYSVRARPKVPIGAGRFG